MTTNITDELANWVLRINTLCADKDIEIERLRNECAHLQFCLNSRDEYLGSIGKWEAYCATLPAGKAGVAGGWVAPYGQPETKDGT